MNDHKPYAIGVDTGGTHTDLVLAGNGMLATLKVPSTPDDLNVGILDGVDRLLAAAGVSVDQVGRFVYASTYVTNLFVEGKEGGIGLLTTAGFRDVLEIGRASRKPDVYDIHWRPARPLVPRDLRHDVVERIDHRGAILDAARRGLRARGVARIVGRRRAQRRRVLPARLCQPGARAARRADRAGGIPDARRLVVVRRRARVPRVRAHEHDVRQRVHPRAHRAASRRPRREARATRHRCARVHHAGQRRRVDLHVGVALADGRRALGRDGRHGRRHRARRRVQRAQPHHARHGRHQRGRFADRRRNAAADQPQPHRAASPARADARHGDDRRRRRLHRVGRRRLRLARRPAQRRLGARAGVLRPGRDATDGDGREPRARASERIVLPGRCAHARPRSCDRCHRPQHRASRSA